MISFHDNRLWAIRQNEIWIFYFQLALVTCSGIATGGSRGAECLPWQQKKMPKREKKREKIGDKTEKIGKKRKNQEEKVKFGNVLSLCPSWQIGLAMLLVTCDWKWNLTCSLKLATSLVNYLHWIQLYPFISPLPTLHTKFAAKIPETYR